MINGICILSKIKELKHNKIHCIVLRSLQRRYNFLDLGKICGKCLKLVNKNDNDEIKKVSFYFATSVRIG